MNDLAAIRQGQGIDGDLNDWIGALLTGAQSDVDRVGTPACPTHPGAPGSTSGSAKLPDDCGPWPRGHGVASASALARASRSAGTGDIGRIAAMMLARVRAAEEQLAEAAIETAALRTKLAEASDNARRDVLTGLPNRRAFEEAFAARGTERCCLALCDIDRFKRVNDDHGHAVGDRVLTEVGHALAADCAGHLVVRHGGEEFAILLRGVDLAAATATLDAARRTLGRRRFRHRDTGASLGRITVSIGVTGVIAGETASCAFDRADRLLYRAKSGGRDRVEAA